MSSERHFEIILSGRQLAGLIGLVALALLAAFGLGVWTGLLEPSRRGPVAAEPPAWRQPAGGGTLGEPDLRPAGTPLAESPAGEALVQPPSLPADLAAVLAAPPPEPSPEPLVPSAEAVLPTPAPPARTPRPTAPPRPTATPRPTAIPQFWIQVGAFSASNQAEGVRQRVMALGFGGDQVLVLAGTGGKYRVRLGPFPDLESAGRVVARLHETGFPDAYSLRE